MSSEDDLAGCFSGLKLFNRKSTKQRQESARNLAVPCCCNVGDAHVQDDKSEPPAYTLSDEAIYRPEVLETIEKNVDSLSGELRQLSLEIHDNPELGFQEKKAHDALSSFMESHGFKVTRHYLDLDTAWRAEFQFGTGGRVIGVNSEMDALPGIGHACGHNLIAICGVGVSIAIKAAFETHKISGKVVLLGTPAEEGGGGKVILLDRGGYKDMDACVMSHPDNQAVGSTGVGSSLAIQKLDVEYFGHTAHAAAAPWEGTNALDAAFLAYSAVSVLRQQIKPDHRVHGIIEGKDWAPNIIPDYAAMRWIVRAPTADEVTKLRARVKNCIEAAALASNCKLEIDESGLPYYELIQNSTLAQNYATIASKRYSLKVLPSEVGIGGSTDFGNITYALPSIHPMFAIPTEPNGGNHTALFAASAATPEAHEVTLLVTKALAHTGVRVVDDDAFFEKVKEAFQKEVPGNKSK